MNRETHLVLLAHGSHDARWRLPFTQLQQRLQQATGLPVELAYLQSCTPDLEQALRQVRAAGATRALVIPAFMSGGGHLLRDVPRTVAEAAARVDGLLVQTAGALAEEEEVMEGMVTACLRLWRSCLKS